MRKIIKVKLILLISLLVACSSTRLIYTLADKFIKDEITYFFYLNKEERIFLNKQVTEMITWHRTTMLPSYAEYLNDIADRIHKGQYGTADMVNVLSNGRSMIEETVTGLTPYASKFLIRQQNVESIEFMEKKMTIRRNERLAEYVKPENVRYKKRLGKSISNFERFFGTLSDEQVLLIEDYIDKTMGDSKIRLSNRTERQKVFVKFLRNQPTEQELTDYLNTLLLNGHLITNPAYQTFSESSLDRFRMLLVNMLSISSAVQRETIISKLRSYAKDFKIVSG
tara:strand:- start:3801 stop:4646 length:846 start_codon:yes stop_codon:yes gene_type:complete